MKRILVLGAAVACFAMLVLAGAAQAADPPVVVPFPAAKVGPIFIAAQTATPTGAMASWFKPGSQVVFRAYAVDTKAKKHTVLAAKDVKYFYVTIPNQPNVKLAYKPSDPAASKTMPWVGTWTIPSTYPAGLVNFKILVKTTAKRVGAFVQMPVASAQLNVSATAPAVLGNGPAPGAAAAAISSPDIVLYADTVNGSSPVAAPKRAIGCTQTNVYKRGEQLVLRTWGFDLSTGQTLTTDNVDTATFTIAGLAPVTLPYGAHGAVGNKVWFWAMYWNIPVDYPLGDVTIHVEFKTDSGKTGTYDHTITIIP